MSPDKHFRDVAEQIVQRSKNRTPKLQRELSEIEARKAEVEALLNSANLARQRLAIFQVKIGADYQCPICWIEREVRAPIRSIGAGTDNEDLFRCSVCGTDFSVSV